MSSSLPTHSRVPRGRHRVGAFDLLLIQRASELIDELGSDLDERLGSERQASERLRLLRATTNRITRTANDAIHAYGRASRAVEAAIDRNDALVEDALAMRAALQAARLELLRALEVASRRYPPTDASATPEL